MIIIYNRNIQVLIAIILISVIALFFSNDRFINIQNRTLVHAIGIDYDKENDKYNITLQVFKPLGSGSDTPIDPTQSNVQIIEGKGKNISDALRVCSSENGRELFMGHLQLIAFGDTVDFSKPDDLFSFCLKDKNIFLRVQVCIAEKSAKELMHTQITRGAMTSENFTQSININTQYGNTSDCELNTFLSALKSPKYFALPVLSVKQPPKDENKEDEQEQQMQGEQSTPGDPMIQIEQTAIIKDGKVLTHKLDHEESMGLAWITKQPDESTLNIKNDDENVFVNITKDKIHTKLRIKNGVPIVECNIRVVAQDVKNSEDTEKSKEIAHQTEKQLKEYCEKAWESAMKEHHADVFGVWRMLRHSYPKVYEKYKDRLDDVYDTARLDVNVKCLVK